MSTLNMLQAINATLRAELARDERVMVLGQDVGRLGGVFRATDGLLDEFGADRVVDMPLAEAAIVGASIGLAASGLVPVAELQFLGFSHQAFHQIGAQLARMRYRSQGRFPMPVVLRAPFGGGVRTPELHSEALEAQFVQSPGLAVVTPATPADAKGLLQTAVRSSDPVLFCEPLRGYRLVTGEVPDEDCPIPFGRSRVAREGDDVTIVAWSAAVQVAEKAADVLAEEGISVMVLDLRTLVPLDETGLIEAVAATGRCVVVHEAPLSAGFGAEVVATVNDGAFWSLEAPVARVAAPDTPYPPGRIEDLFVPTVARVVAAVRATVKAG
ncbi:alpha-ketoacid dehydrogenase subunit beta [Blastococcus sp. TF02A-26]|uniref:alpha-ketoacid dehydrogenase subunit beta n=1 Tax=Blastococcus sp. TF02A-26 TaxID=2250577 RepID=UPI000DEA71BA|nr:alpha-ketoacid dehydrogenase subunit beta [Blastococcus sp. TF02A-26]RBY85995.1 alpha-ketoacid dehydrogenase subunit beta [Blastococcus sp. TF02A-26]